MVQHALMMNRFFNTFSAPKEFISDNGGVSDKTQLFIRNENIK